MASGCRCSSDEPSPQAVVAAQAPAPACTRSSVQLTLAPNAAEGAPSAQPLDPNLELPFATEPGVGLALGTAFYATALRHESKGAVALLGRLGNEATPPALLELGRVRGDVLPPRLASDGSDLWVVLQEGTGGGRELRVSRFAGGDLGAAPSWRSGPVQTSAESSGFDIAARAGGALLVYDEWSAENHGQVLAAVIATGDAGRIQGHPVTPARVDAEAPRVSARPDGYWLAWLVNGSSAGAGRVYDPGDEVSERAATGSAYGARWLQLVALDAAGKVSGEVRRLTGRQERVIGFDLTTGPAGSAWLTWRQDAPTPGASGGRVFVAEVQSDGKKQIQPLRDEDVGAGEPTWLVSGAGAPWLSFPDARDRTLLMRVERPGDVHAPLRLGAELEGAGALAARGSEVLFALPRGRALELFPATCQSPSSGSPWGDAGLENAAAEASDAGSPARAP